MKMTKKKLIKWEISVAILCVFLIFVNALIGAWVCFDIKKYEAAAEMNDILPKLNELGEYEKVNFKYYHDNMLIFQSEAYILKVSYNEENYQKQKNEINEKYIFQTEWVSDRGVEIEYKKSPSFEIDSFQMNMLSIEDYKIFYPHEMVFVGTSDENRIITYVYYFSDDRDYISKNFSDFLKSDCGW